MTLMMIGQHRLMRRECAAAYLGLSVTKFDKLLKDGILPQPSPLSSLYGYKVWDRADCDRWVDLHRGGEAAAAPCAAETRAARNPYAHLERPR